MVPAAVQGVPLPAEGTYTLFVLNSVHFLQLVGVYQQGDHMVKSMESGTSCRAVSLTLFRRAPQLEGEGCTWLLIDVPWCEHGD